VGKECAVTTDAELNGVLVHTTACCVVNKWIKTLLWNKLEFISFTSTHLHESNALIYTLNDHIGGLHYSYNDRFVFEVVLMNLILLLFETMEPWTFWQSTPVHKMVVLQVSIFVAALPRGWFIRTSYWAQMFRISATTNKNDFEWIECLIQLNLKCTLCVCTSWLLVFAVRCVT